MLELLIFGVLTVATILDILYHCIKRKGLVKIAIRSPLEMVYKAIIHKILAAKYIFGGVKMIEKAYAEANGRPFIIYTPGKKHTMVTSKKHIRELSQAPSDTLSLHAVAKYFLQPKHTMHGFEWKDQRGVEGVGFVRALKTLLTSHLPTLLPSFEAAISDQFEIEIMKHKVLNGYHHCPIFAATKIIIARTNCLAFFGAELASDQKFITNALKFPEDVYIAAEVLRVVPESLGLVIAGMMTRGHRSSKLMYEWLYPVVEQRLRLRDANEAGLSIERPSDCIQWVVETSPRKACWSVERLVGEIMGMWVGSWPTIVIATTNAVIDLYSHPECIERLREELQGPMFDDFRATSNGLPLLDSFLRESIRVNSFESTVSQRQALSPFTFSDGLRIERGDWVCVPHRAMMRDSQHFEDAQTFDAFRFAHSKNEKTCKLVDPSEKWLVWGAGRILCPGRFYATMIMKLVLAHMLLRFDCQMQDFQGSRTFQWRSSEIPKSSVVLGIKLRETAASNRRLD